MKNRIKEIMSKVFNVAIEDINEQSSRETIENWDSLNQLNLVVELEEEFGIELTPEEIGEMNNFEYILGILETKRN